jgi:hypothetical protein
MLENSVSPPYAGHDLRAQHRRHRRAARKVSSACHWSVSAGGLSAE